MILIKLNHDVRNSVDIIKLNQNILEDIYILVNNLRKINLNELNYSETIL